MEGETPVAAVTAASQVGTALTQAATQAATLAATAVSGASEAIARTGFGLVLDKVYYFIMVPMVYLAMAFFVVAVVAKIVGVLRAGPAPFQLATYPEPRNPKLAAWRDAFGMPQIRKKKPLFWFFLMVYHLGFVLLILGHLDILPQVNIVSPESRHMVGAGLVGLMVTVPTFYFLGRRFRGIDRAISTPGDYILLLLLLFLFLLGDMISWGNSWTARGFVMTKQDFSLYFDSLARFTFADPRGVLPGSHYHFVVLHVLLANLLFITLPFTKVMHTFFAVPLNLVRRMTWTRK
jgi:nitrate reductase gamma subunit